MKKLIFYALFLIYISTGFAQTKIDSLKNLLYEVEDTQKVTVLVNLASLLIDSNEIEAIKFSDEAIEVAIKSDNKQKIAEAYFVKGNLFREIYKYVDALIYYKKTLEIAEKENNKKLLSEIYNSIGIAYYLLAQYENAVEFFIKHADFNKSEGDLETYANALNNSAIVCYYIEEYDRALEYFSIASEIFKNLNLIEKQYSVKVNLGAIYYEKQMYDTALTYYLDCLQYRENVGTNFKGIASLKHNIGLVYFDLKDYKTSLEYLNASLIIKEENNFESEIANTLVYTAQIFQIESNITKALQTIDKAINLAEKYNDKQHLSDAYKVKYDIEKKSGNYKEALFALEKYKELYDTIFSQEKTKTIAEMQSKYDYEKKEAENLLLIKDQEKKSVQIKKQKTTIWFSGISLLLVIILAVVFFSGRLKQKKINEELELKNIEITQKNEEILSQSEAIVKMNLELQRLSIVASETDNAILLMSPEGDLEWANEAFTRIYGYNLTEITERFGKNIKKISSTNNINNYFNICTKNKKSISYESFLFTKNNEKVWAQTTLTPIVDEMGYVKSIIAIDSDITKLKFAEQEIKNQNEEIMAQKDELEFKNSQISLQNFQIKESIEAALKIQTAILPVESSLRIYFDFFIFYKPKDIVSGDYYWFSDKHYNTEKILFFAVIDCTGHGVPGAFMSLISNSIINSLINEKHILNPAQILEDIDINVRSILNQHNNKNMDGLDICLCKIDRSSENDIVTFSGAKRPLFYFSCKDNEIHKISPTRRSIGGIFHQTKIFDFENTELAVGSDDIIFFTSDGFSDQANHERKSFGTSKLLKVLHENIKFDMNKQKQKLEQSLRFWQQDTPQRDDITVVGLKLI